MKKTLVASTLALGLGITGVASADNAQAAEQTDVNVNKAELAQLALNESEQLNQKPVQEGSYDFSFDLEGYNFHFWSNGTTFGWAYKAHGLGAPIQDVNHAATTATNETPANQVASQQQATSQAPAPTQAPTSSSANTGKSVNVNGHLQQIAQRESGGDIRAINPSSGAAGKYQFLQSTWDSVAPAGWAGKSPASAPEHIQDQAAVKLYNTAGPSQWVTA